MFRRTVARLVRGVWLITVLSPSLATAQRVPAAAPAPEVGFEPNVGQFDATVQFASRGRGYTLFLTDSDAVMAVGGVDGQAVVRMALERGRPVRGEGRSRQRTTVNYLRGTRTSWRTDVPTYARVAFADAAPGVDLVFYGRQGGHEYDLIVGEGVDPAGATLRFSGADRLALEPDGALSVVTTAGTIRMKSPLAYQEIAGVRRAVPARYVVNEARVGFALENTTRPHPW